MRRSILAAVFLGCALPARAVALDGGVVLSTGVQPLIQASSWTQTGDSVSTAGPNAFVRLIDSETIAAVAVPDVPSHATRCRKIPDYDPIADTLTIDTAPVSPMALPTNQGCAPFDVAGDTLTPAEFNQYIATFTTTFVSSSPVLGNVTVTSSTSTAGSVLIIPHHWLWTRWRDYDWRVSDRAVIGGGGYFGDDFETGVLFPSKCWDVSARVKTFRFRDEFSGDETEFSGRLARKLPHVSVAGRLGTAPPNAQRLAYRLAAGEIVLSFYGVELGPEDPASAASVSEDTTTAAVLSHLDTTWVTRFRGRFTTTNFHREPVAPGGNTFVLVENYWQFDLAETWKDMATLALHNGHARYSQIVASSDPVFSHWNVDYQGAPVALKGWPNNHVGADLTQRWNGWIVRAGFTRINMLFGGLEVLAGGEAAWRPEGRSFEARAGWYQHTTRGVSTRSAWTLGGAYRW